MVAKRVARGAHGSAALHGRCGRGGAHKGAGVADPARRQDEPGGREPRECGRRLPALRARRLPAQQLRAPARRPQPPRRRRALEAAVPGGDLCHGGGERTHPHRHRLGSHRVPVAQRLRPLRGHHHDRLSGGQPLRAGALAAPGAGGLRLERVQLARVPPGGPGRVLAGEGAPAAGPGEARAASRRAPAPAPGRRQPRAAARRCPGLRLLPGGREPRPRQLPQGPGPHHHAAEARRAPAAHRGPGGVVVPGWGRQAGGGARERRDRAGGAGAGRIRGAGPAHLRHARAPADRRGRRQGRLLRLGPEAGGGGGVRARVPPTPCQPRRHLIK